MNKINLLSPFKRLCITIGELPTAYIESMSYYEGLTYLVNYLCNNVIPTVNENGKAVEELQNKYLELVSYVEHYFDNLDVQEEINNKLDEMADEGQLATLILEYLEMSGLMMYDTLLEMKGTDHVIDGSYLETAGTLTYDDGKRALYRVREKAPDDVIDDVELVGLTNYPDLVAEKLMDYRLDDIEDQIANLEDSLTDTNTTIGDLENLTSSNKTSVVNAINSVISDTDTLVDTTVGDLNNLDTTDKSDVVNAINELKEDIDTKAYMNYDNNFRYYIDGTNGNDDNDGLTSETAFRTLDKFLNLLNTYKGDIRCYIISAGNYYINKTNITNGILHITGNGSGVVITTELNEMVFYDGHINFQNLTVDIPEATSHYYENCAVTFKNVVYRHSFRLYGGTLGCENCTINSLRLSTAKAVLDNCIIDGNAKTLDAIRCDASSTLTIWGGLTVQHLNTPSENAVIALFRSTMFAIDGVTNQTSAGDYAYGLKASYCVIVTNNETLTGINACGTANTTGHSLTVTNTTNLPS